MRQKQLGFTLVEIAIVLVIIGLLLGGVLKGQELITQAKIKNVANDFNATAAAVLAYQDRYKKLPGDDDGAPTRWTTPALTASTGTAGNGTIEGGYNPTVAGTETGLFWAHLRLAGFITGDASTATEAVKPPLNAAGGVLGVQPGGGAGPAFITGGIQGIAGHALCSSNLPGKIASAIDSQFDDGKPDTGAVRGFALTSNNMAVNETTAPAPVYSEDAGSIYLVCRGI